MRNLDPCDGVSSSRFTFQYWEEIRALFAQAFHRTENRNEIREKYTRHGRFE